MINVSQLSPETVIHLSKKEYGEEYFCSDSRKYNFRVKEFACKDGSDEVLVSVELVNLLQLMRDCVKQPIIINSGYRTASYNSKVGGASRSQHLLGKAADIVVGTGHANPANSLKVAILASQLGFRGIGTYKTFTHVDVRDQTSYFDYSGQNTIWLRSFIYKKGGE